MAVTATEAAALRRALGMLPDPRSDAVWASRPWATTQQVISALRAKQSTSTPIGAITNIGGTSGSGGGGGTSEPAAPTGPARDFRAEAAGLYPWLTGQLLNEFAGFYADTGNAAAALGKLRTQSSTYDRVFAGIKREDGSLRINEAEYFSDKAGFAEVLREFGKDPAQYESKFADLVRNDVRAQEFAQAAASGFQRFVEPGANDTGLFGMFLDTFISTGAEEVALREVRNSSAYDKVFDGNRREDGTLRMEEPEYFAYIRGVDRLLVGHSLNPQEFRARGRHGQLVRGEVSVQEVGQRLQAVQDGILDRADQIREFYANNYGLDLTNEAILGMAIDPTIQRDVLERRITAGQIGGEASLQGFKRTVQRAEELARAGITGDAARGLYSQAGMQLGGLSATSARFNRGRTSLDQFEQAIGLGDAGEMGRLQGVLREEQSQFTGRSDTRRSQDGFGLSGLRQR